MLTNLSEEEGKKSDLQNDNIDNIPPSIYSNNSFKDFCRITKAYYKELKTVNKNNGTIGKDDMSVINNLMTESNEYSSILIKEQHLKEANKLNKLTSKIVEIILQIFTKIHESENKMNNNLNLPTTSILFYPLFLKLSTLETKFQLVFQVEENYEEAEKIIQEVLKLQIALQLPKFNIGCSTFYSALIKFCNYLT